MIIGEWGRARRGFKKRFLSKQSFLKVVCHVTRKITADIKIPKKGLCLTISIKWLELAHSRILLLQRAVKSPTPKREPFLQSRRFKSPNSQSSNGCQCVPSISWTHRAMADSDACKSNPFVRFSCCNLIFNLNFCIANLGNCASLYKSWKG